MRKVENFKLFLASIRNDAEFNQSYKSAVDKVGAPATRADQKINYKQLYFQVIDTIVGMLNERFQDVQSFAFLDLVNPKLFRNYGGTVPSNKLNLLKERYEGQDPLNCDFHGSSLGTVGSNFSDLFYIIFLNSTVQILFIIHTVYKH